MRFEFILKPLNKIFIMLVILFSINAHYCWATISGVPQFDYQIDDTPPACIVEGDDQIRGSGTPALKPGSCSYSMSGYVPSGYYSLFYLTGMDSTFRPLYSNSVYINSNTPLQAQNIYFHTSSTIMLPSGSIGYSLCIAMMNSDDNNKGYAIVGTRDNRDCGGRLPPVPPTPPIPDTSCTINNGNALSVSLGTLNRDEIPTVPDSGSAISKTISVNCTGGTVTANMKLNYTPISIGSSQAVKSSANGVGAAIFYGNKALSPSDVTSLNFLEGSNTLTLGFQAVRDSTVALKDIPTGAFTANAVLVMTQQ
ncbi:fimbrial protein [Lelliottia amnigena]